MAIKPSVPEIITVNSEALQTQIRDLLPSQNGFGSELQASNVITPVIDLTAAAAGDILAANLQTALAFGSQTAFSTQNTTTNLANSPGFWRVVGSSVIGSRAALTTTRFDISGVSVKQIWAHSAPGVSTSGGATGVDFDLVVFLKAGETLQAVSTLADAIIAGSYRQIATGDGTLVNPQGFPL